MLRLLLTRFLFLAFACGHIESLRINRLREEHFLHAEEVFNSMTVIDELTEFESDVILEEEATDEENFAISSPENNYQSFAILAPNITIPEKRTTYWCSVHKLPDYANMVHGVGFEKSIVGKSKGLIHHMEVFGCDINDGEIPYYSGECDVPAEPEQLSRCAHVLGAWASGAKTFWYPEEAGLTFFSFAKSQYVLLEVHYNNPNHVKDIVDVSGIQFFYSNQRREFEVGVLEIGNIYTSDMVIPPRQKMFSWPGICSSECTKVALPPGGINIFGSQLHAHLTGRRLYTVLNRGFTELPEIDRDDNYSTWNEVIHSVVPPRKVLPGDQITLNCEFNTEDKDDLTYGGMGIDGEMCVSYIHYYPASDLEVCKSAISKQSLKRFLKMEDILEHTIFPAVSAESYDDINWNSSAVDRLDIAYQHATLNVHCLKPNGEPWEGKWNEVPHYNFEF